MKLKNKKTGEVKDWSFGNWYQMILNPDNKESYECSLTDFMDRVIKFREEWEDYEGPKTFWAISWAGEPEEYDAKNTPQELREMAKAIGNYFETKEEAEKAVEKLKAWKRLKDKSFKLINYSCPLRKLYFEVDGGKFFEASGEVSEETRTDLTLLFVGEE